jgi:hypothetical protein
MSGNSCSCHFSVQLSVGEQHIPLPKGDSMRIRAGARLKAMGEIGHAVLQYSLIAQSSGCSWVQQKACGHDPSPRNQLSPAADTSTDTDSRIASRALARFSSMKSGAVQRKSVRPSEPPSVHANTPVSN